MTCWAMEFGRKKNQSLEIGAVDKGLAVKWEPAFTRFEIQAIAGSTIFIEWSIVHPGVSIFVGNL